MKGKILRIGMATLMALVVLMTFSPVAYAESTTLARGLSDSTITPTDSNSIEKSSKEIQVNSTETKQVIEPELLPFKDIKVGDIITTGKRGNQGDCVVSFGIKHEFGLEEIGIKNVRTIVDENCNVIVVEKNISLYTAKISDSSLGILSSQDTGYSYIFMYGLGGQWDKLTQRYTQMTWGWDGSSAWVISGSGWCKWSAGTGWSNTDCSHWYNPSSGDWVNMYGTGDFHWINNRYQHTLWTRVSGSKSGSFSCTYWYTGSIVRGTNGQCARGTL